MADIKKQVAVDSDQTQQNEVVAENKMLQDKLEELNKEIEEKTELMT